jgi:hypothetical protein
MFWEQLSRLTTIGVPLAGGVAPYLIPRALMIGVAVGQRRSDEWGPDLTLIRIPSSHVARIEAHKVAYNLTMRADSVLRDGPAVSEGCWVILGAPDERAQLDAHGGMLNEMAAFGAIAQTHARDGFDYVDFGIDRTGSSVGAPVSFGGVSGGGCGRSALRDPPQVILSGIGRSTWRESPFINRQSSMVVRY